MVSRCTNPNSHKWARYGARGIAVCNRWLIFANFLTDMGEKPPGMSIERENNDGNYEPGNCRWATRKEQGNNRQTNRLLSLNGKTQTLTQWAEELGISQQTIRNRIARGLPIDKCLSPTVRQRTDSETKTHCKHGHSLADAYVYINTRTGKPARQCKTCRRQYW